MMKRRSIRFRLVAAVNLPLIVFLAAFLVYEHQREIKMRVDREHVSLGKEARTLLAAVSRLRDQGHPAVQAYIDEVCGQMQDTFSPGHHIVVSLDGTVLQAVAHHRASPEIFRAMQAAAASPTHRARFGQEELVAGKSDRGDVAVYVSEYLTNIRRSARRHAWQRAVRILFLAALAGVFVNVVFLRMVVRSLRQLATTVRRIAEGNLGVQTAPFSGAELAYLADAVNSMSTSLARSDRRRRQEMAQAARIQRQLLPRELSLPGAEMACLFQPVEAVAGDYYDVVGLPNGAWLMCVADVSGHGVPAAMSATMLKALLQHAIEHHPTPAAILAFLNRQLLTICQTDNLASMFLARWDSAAMTLDFASAGHETCLFLSVDGTLRELRSTGLMLGVLDDAAWETQSLQVRRGDRLLLVTDGVTEAMSPQGDLFGRRRLAQGFCDRRGQGIDDVIRSIDYSLGKHRQGAAPTDDATALVVEFSG